MSLTRAATLFFISAATAGCGAPASSEPTATPFRVGPTIPPFVRPATPAPTPSDEPSQLPTLAPSTSGPAARPAVPERFPLPDDAEPALIDPDDLTMIGHWYVPQGGYDLYHFYIDQLPPEGYPIAGLYPSDIGSMIRFDAGEQILQVHMSGSLDETDLVLRTDIP